MDHSHTQLSAFMEHYNYQNLTKNNTCFKGDDSCIDLILSNRKYCFKKTSSFETGISDHFHFLYSMLKRTFEKEESKKLPIAIVNSFNGKPLKKIWQAI